MDCESSVMEAIAIKNGKIVKVGANEEILSMKEENTEIIDLLGKLILPGFNDSHIHLINYGYTLTMVDLIGVKSIDETGRRILDFVEKNNIKKGSWIRGRGWNQDYFVGEKKFPTRYDLDSISSDFPLVLTRACGHVVVVNTEGLKLLNITKDTPQVEGGHFDLDENGEPLGIFREQAVNLIYDLLPIPSMEEIKTMVKMAIMEMNKYGITSVGTDDFEALPNKDYNQVIMAYLELKKDNRLNIRINQQCLLPSIHRYKSFLEDGYNTGWGDENYKIGPLKLLLDGSLGARTAALSKPYEDDSSTMGILTMSKEELSPIVDLANKNNTQLAIHAIGDKAMYMAFENIEKSLEENPNKDHRHGIVHCQITDETLLDKFKELNMIAHIQPIFLDYDWKIVKDRVGEDLESTSYNWKTLVEKGVNIACGSDAPVETFNPLYGIYEAVTRKDLEGNPGEGWLPNQKLTVQETVYGYTMGGAYATFEEKIKGSIEKGKLADLVVLSKDIFEIHTEEIKGVKVLATFLGGKVVYKR